MKEFQALGLDISIINDKGENLGLKEIEEDEEKEDTNPVSEIVDTPALPVSEDTTDESYDEEETDESEEEDYDFDESEIEVEEEGADL